MTVGGRVVVCGECAWHCVIALNALIRNCTLTHAQAMDLYIVRLGVEDSPASADWLPLD
jgi:hypothetical protein